MDNIGSLFNSNEGIIFAVVGLLVVFWLAKKIIKMVIGLALIAGIIFYLTNYM